MIDTRLGPWVLERQLGRGGMGTVFLARREGPGEALPDRAAIKVLAPELAQTEGFLRRFQREIEILRQLDHPHIVRFLSSGQQAGHSYFAMEYVEGPSYETLCRQKGMLPWREVLDLALQVAPALKHAHDRGIVHRDLKPSNLLRAAGPDGGPLVKLTDFGIASLFAGQHLTVTGAIVGTAEFLSPEQAAGKPATKRSDLYSLGVVLYTLLLGRPPFQGETLAVLHKHRYGQFERPSRIVPDLPPDFEEIICQLLEKDPSARIPDGAVLHRRLDSLRRKLQRQEAGEEIVPANALLAEGDERQHAARVMSRLMREELHRQNTGGPVRRFFNRPWVVVPLFLLTLGLIVWSFWPASTESLYRQGAALMQSDDPSDWERAWEDYFEPLEERHPDHPYQEELAEFRSLREAGQAVRDAARRARRAGPMTEAQWFYQRGLRLRQEGDEEGARKVWRALVAAFGEVPSEGPWVKLAEKELGKEGPDTEEARRWGPVRQALERARELEKEGKPAGAREIREGLKLLYGADAEARKVLEEGPPPGGGR